MGYYLRRYNLSSSGAYTPDGSERDLEKDFGYIRYGSLSGLNSRGSQSGVYTESYAESSSLRIYLSPSAIEASTTCTLTVYCFGSSPEKSVSSSSSLLSMVSVAESCWHTFFDWLEGGLILWRDDVRNRKSLFFVKDSCEPSSDVVKGFPYLCCSVKLVNVFGKSFAMSDKTIENWLLNGGKDS